MNWDGLLLINKPEGETSHTIVQMVKNKLKATKAGHLGTLDPLATGVFPVCVGKATRLSPFYMGADKCYLTAIRFGFFTTTDDREGEQEGPYRRVDFSEDQLKRILTSFTGEYEQKPPVYSAKKIKGKPAHRLARRGMKPELPVHKVRIHEISLIHLEKDVATIYIHCSSGTYVRAIARDLGMRLRCGAHVQELTRTKFGAFSLEQTISPNESLEKFKACFIPIERMLTDLPEIIIDASLGRKVSTGSAIDVKENFNNEWVRIFSEEKSLLAVAHVEPGEGNQRLQPKIVFT
jgi:tRNA pseudouridine55 synthase